MNFLYRIQWFLYRQPIRLYFRLTLKGLERLPLDGPVLLAANHCSFLDPPLIGFAIPRQITFLAKRELFSIPLLGRWIRSVGAFPVARNQGDAKAVRTVLNLLRMNKTILMFPEGTRSMDGQIQPLESGVAWFSIKTGVPIVPIYIHGTLAAMPRKAWFPRPYRVQVTIGESIDPNSIDQTNSKEERIRMLTEMISSTLRCLQTACISNKLNL